MEHGARGTGLRGAGGLSVEGFVLRAGFTRFTGFLGLQAAGLCGACSLGLRACVVLGRAAACRGRCVVAGCGFTCRGRCCCGLRV